jgi:aryl-alcohol dehydrogenase-like predicted oxidoreductase
MPASRVPFAYRVARAQIEDIVPIPGTRRSERLDENARAATVALPPLILARINELAALGLAEGATLM